MKTNYLLQFGLAFGTMAALMSCSKDMDIPTYEESQKSSYSENFVAKYGAINPQQSWDFTTGEIGLATRGATTIKTEIMEKGVNFGDLTNMKKRRKEFYNHSWDYDIIEGGTEKNSAILEAIFKTLPEEMKWSGKPAVLVAPTSSFYIYPLFSGGNIRFDLKVKVGDQEAVTVFTKDYTNFQTINGMKKANGDIINMKGIKIEAPVGTPVEIYLDNLLSLEGKSLASAGTSNGQAVYVDIKDDVKLELEDIQLPENAVIKYIGIEDQVSGGDRDYNDMVLAVVGNPDVPQEKIITNNQYDVKTCRTKRYMIEDLGATDDFDFNDVVVDVSENTITTHSVTYENGILKSDVVTNVASAPTTAIIRAMGGTIDFELSIGTTKWVKSENGYTVKTMYNTQGTIDYNKVLAEFEVTGWNYESNNISISVKDEKSGQVYTVTFPKAGTAPMIIAVDPTQNWMGERVSVPASWFTTNQ